MSRIRRASPADLPALRQVWRSVFGDSEEFLSLFFTRLYPACTAFAAETAEGVAGGAYLLGGFALRTGDRALPCPYIYAVGVLEERRGLGLGKALSLACRDEAARLGQASCLVPAEESLFHFYEKEAGFAPLFHAAEGVAPRGGSAEVTALSPEEYLAWREKLLSPLPHLSFDAAVAAFLAENARLSGGGLYLARLPDGERAVALLEEEDGLFAKELLAETPGREADFAAALAERFSRPDCRWRCPPGGAGTERAFGMFSGALPHPAHSAYFGPAFD